MKFRGHFYTILIFTLSVNTLTSCSGNKKAQPESVYSPVLQVDALKIIPQYFESVIKVTANILPFEQVDLKAPVSATVLSINVNEGQFVKQGQLIVRLDDRAWIAQKKGLEAQLLSANTDLNRKTELIKMEGASQQEVDQAIAKVDGLEAQIEELDVKISLSNISAPFDGIVGMRDFSIGSYLTQGQTITTITQNWKLKVDFNLPSQYNESVYSGKIVYLIIENDTVKSEIYALNPVANSTSRTLQVRSLISNNEKKIFPGDFAEVIVPLKADENAILIPSESIIPELNKQTVFIYKGGKTLRQEIKTGERNERMVQVLSGISEGDTLIITGLLQLRNNAPVSVKLQSGPKAL